MHSVKILSILSESLRGLHAFCGGKAYSLLFSGIEFEVNFYVVVVALE